MPIDVSHRFDDVRDFTDAEFEVFDDFRGVLKKYAQYFEEELPESREKSKLQEHLELCKFWLEQAINHRGVNK